MCPIKAKKSPYMEKSCAIFPTNQCMFDLLMNLKKPQFKLKIMHKLQYKILAFAAAGVRPEPKGWPGKATLRPVIMID